MGKKFGDFTFREAAEVCRANTDYLCRCGKDCPLKDDCGETKHIRILTCDKERLDQEIEVEENENI